ncbi:bombyxin B-10-like isoform X2 [Coccinella septempunctata]|uniref:bombyxin B-10-like isoform X2 n=1 Tax=Coccinella septempunctata TaxID=41139 RepID=UPI001D0650F2|nr:bombyxin B-10-like isoform X2 [Coccinella septempunctata]
MNCRVVFISAICLISASRSFSSISNVRLHRYCGTALKEKMDEVCFEGEGENSIDKEPIHWNQKNSLAAGIYPSLNDAVNFIPIRHQRGIIEECCINRCSTDTLKAYCSR